MAKLICEFQEYINEYKIFKIYGNGNFAWVLLRKGSGMFEAAFEYLDDARDYACGYMVSDIYGNYSKIE